MTRWEAELFHKRIVKNAHKTEVVYMGLILARHEGIRTGWCNTELITPDECEAMILELKQAYRYVGSKLNA